MIFETLVRNSLSETNITESYVSLLSIDEAFDVLIQQLDEMEDTLDGCDVPINENYLEDFADIMTRTKILLTKGKKAMQQHTQDTAQQISSYKKEVEDYLGGMDKLVFKKEMELKEVFVMVVDTGYAVITYTEIKPPEFYNKTFDYKKYLSLIDDNVPLNKVKKQFNKDARKAKDLARFRASVRKETNITKRVMIADSMKTFSNQIELCQKMSARWSKSSDDMGKWIDGVIRDIKQFKDSSTNEENYRAKITMMKKCLNVQKLVYRHNTRLLDALNQMIIMQSRYIKDNIKKYARVNVSK